MKKFIVAGICLAVFACIVAPGLIGRVVERQIHAALEEDRLGRAFGLTDSVFSVSIRSYQRGWFGSRGQLAVNLDDELLAQVERDVGASESGAAITELLRVLRAQSDDEVIFNVDVRHGPILLGHSPAWGLYAASIQADEADPLAKELRQSFGVERIVDVRLHGGFSRDVSVHVEFPAIAFAKDGLAIDFSGSQFNGYFHPSPRLVDISGQIASLDLAIGKARVSIGAMQAHSHYVEPVADVWIGESRVGMAHFLMNGAAPEERFELVKWGIHSRSGFADDETHVDFDGTLSLDKLLVGSGDEVVDGSMAFAVRGVPQDVLKSYREFAGEISALGRAPSEEQEARMRELLGDLVKAAPRLEIGPIEFLTKKGEFRGWVNATVDGERMPSTLRISAVSALPLFLMAGRVEGQLSAPAEVVSWLLTPILQNQLRAAADAAGQEISQEEVDAIVAERVRTMLDNALSSGLLRRLDGNRLESAMEFAKGKLTVNGTAIPLLR